MQTGFHRGVARRLIDAGVAASIRRGAGPSQRHLLTVTGRASGKPHTTPVSLVIDGSSRYLVAAFGETEWVRNARMAPLVTLSRAGRSEQFNAVELAATEAAPVLRRYLEMEPMTRPRFGATPDATNEALTAIAADHPVFRLAAVT